MKELLKMSSKLFDFTTLMSQLAQKNFSGLLEVSFRAENRDRTEKFKLVNGSIVGNAAEVNQQIDDVLANNFGIGVEEVELEFRVYEIEASETQAAAGGEISLDLFNLAIRVGDLELMQHTAH